MGKNGIWIWRISQSIILLLLLIVMYRKNGRDNILSLIVLISAFLALPQPQASDGMYWMTASVIYVVPLLPFFLSCLEFHVVCFGKGMRKISNKMLYLCLFLATFSQEQIACAAAFYISICAMGWYLLNRGKLSDLPEKKIVRNGLLACYLGFAAVICSPGNFRRASGSSTPYWESLTIKLKRTAVLSMYLRQGKCFQYIFLLAILTLIIYLFRKKKLGFLPMLTGSLFSGWLLLINITYGQGTYNSLMRFTKYNEILTSGVLYAHLAMASIVLFLFYWRIRNDMALFLIWMSGIVTMAAIIILPTFLPYRASVPFYFMIIFVISNALTEVLADAACRCQKAIVLGLTICLVCSSANYASILEGYIANAGVHRINDAKLKLAAQQYALGEPVEQIVLYKLPDDRYASTQAYQSKRVEWINDCMLLYYALPQNIEIRYEDYIKLQE